MSLEDFAAGYAYGIRNEPAAPALDDAARNFYRSNQTAIAVARGVPGLAKTVGGVRVPFSTAWQAGREFALFMTKSGREVDRLFKAEDYGSVLATTLRGGATTIKTSRSG